MLNVKNKNIFKNLSTQNNGILMHSKANIYKFKKGCQIIKFEIYY